MANINDMLNKASGKTKWEQANDRIIEYLNNMKLEGKINDFIVKKLVPDKIWFYILMIDKHDGKFEVMTSNEIDKIYDVCNISVYEMVEDHNMGIRWATNQRQVDMALEHAGYPLSI